MKSVIIFSLIISFIFLQSPHLYAYSQIPGFLCELGIKFYQQGKYKEALSEFKKALLAAPNYEPALKYIEMIEQMKVGPDLIEGIIPEAFSPVAATPAEAVNEIMDLIEIQREMIQQRKLIVGELPIIEIEKEESPPRVLTLDASLGQIHQPIEIEQGKSILVRGKNIKRFLLTQPEILTVERKNTDEISVSGRDIGYTYLHVWDDYGRWTSEWLGVFPKPEGPTVEELMLAQQERAQTFKLRYTLGWHAFEQGRRIKTLNRQSYSWSHGLSLNGATPYGDLDSTVTIRALEKTTDLTHFTLGLTNAKFWSFKDFSLRGFDFAPGAGNLAISGGGATLRGVRIQSPVFNKKINYTAFWGREGGGRYGNLSPGLSKIQNSFLNGVDVKYYPLKETSLGFSLVHGYGRDRPNYLNHYAYDANADWRLGKWQMGYEIGYDTETFAHLFDGNYSQPKINFNYEIRNIDKDYLNIGGETWRRGELGGLVNVDYRPTETLSIYNHLDVYQDRLFPSLESDDRWNEDYAFNTVYTFAPETSLRLDYSLQNNLGKISQYRYQTQGLGIAKTFTLIRKISTYLNYRHQVNNNFSGPSMDYRNENISLGIRFSLIGQLYYFLNKQWNWLKETYAGNHSWPHALETGVDLSSQILNSPFYENIHFIFRDEEKTDSNLSFLSGEDYIEGYAELSYRPNPDREAYCSARIRNVWSEKPAVEKRLEADFNAGMRYLWDTSVRWESVGNIEGYVFKDLNSDGLRQRDEVPVEGIRIWLGKNKSASTDIFGYYKFKNIKGRKITVAMDTQGLPSGFVLTVPQMQEVEIIQGRTTRVDFGMVSRSEISGFVFEDANGDGKYNAADKGVKGVILTLEDGTKVVTDNEGKFFFRNAAAGEHNITLDLKSIPLYYLPQVPLIKKITLFEGVTYLYNIPFKRIKD